jgi:hypothetical protein
MLPRLNRRPVHRLEAHHLVPTTCLPYWPIRSHGSPWQSRRCSTSTRLAAWRRWRRHCRSEADCWWLTIFDRGLFNLAKVLSPLAVAQLRVYGLLTIGVPKKPITVFHPNFEYLPRGTIESTALAYPVMGRTCAGVADSHAHLLAVANLVVVFAIDDIPDLHRLQYRCRQRRNFLWDRWQLCGAQGRRSGLVHNCTVGGQSGGTLQHCKYRAHAHCNKAKPVRYLFPPLDFSSASKNCSKFF